jgi:hypothetical protein
VGQELLSEQTPLTHDSPLGQAKPQSPQFVADVLRFTQAPLQLVYGVVQDVVVP